MGENGHTEYLVMRHGQSTADLATPKIFEGQLDTPLSGKGLEQARRAAGWIARHYPPDRIIASTLARAKKTAETVAGKAGLPIEYDAALMERSNGVLAGMQKNTVKLERQYAPHETVEGGETLIAFRARAEHFWSNLLGQNTIGQRILIVSHGQMIDMLFQCFLRLPLEEHLLRTGDTGIHCWRVGPKGRSVLFCNAREHLPIRLR